MKYDMDELKKALEDVSDTYDDFVRGLLLTVKNHQEYYEELLNFMKNNKSATTSEVITYLDKLRGLI